MDAYIGILRDSTAKRRKGWLHIRLTFWVFLYSLCQQEKLDMEITQKEARFRVTLSVTLFKANGDPLPAMHLFIHFYLFKPSTYSVNR